MHGAAAGGDWHGAEVLLGYMFLFSEVAGDILHTFLSFVIECRRPMQQGMEALLTHVFKYYYFYPSSSVLWV